jgi:hypothetical protein
VPDLLILTQGTADTVYAEHPIEQLDRMLVSKRVWKAEEAVGRPGVLRLDRQRHEVVEGDEVSRDEGVDAPGAASGEG